MKGSFPSCFFFALFFVFAVATTPPAHASHERRIDFILGNGTSDNITSGPDEGKGGGGYLFLFQVADTAILPENVRLHAGTIERKGDTWNVVGADYVLQSHWGEAAGCGTTCPWVEVGYGLSYFNERTHNLSARAELHLVVRAGTSIGKHGQVGWGFDHWSTGGLWGERAENRGETFFLWSFGLAF